MRKCISARGPAAAPRAKLLAFISSSVCASLLATAAHAGLVGGAPVLTPISATAGTWSPGPAYQSLPTSGLSIASASTAQGNTTAVGSGTQTAMSETFTPGSGPAFGAPNSSGFTLGKIAILAGGGAGGNIVSMHLYA